MYEAEELGVHSERSKPNAWHFKLQPMEWIEEELKELAEVVPDARTLQLLSANPLCMTYDKLASILEKINQYLPKMEYIYTPISLN